MPTRTMRVLLVTQVSFVFIVCCRSERFAQREGPAGELAAQPQETKVSDSAFSDFTIGNNSNNGKYVPYWLQPTERKTAAKENEASVKAQPARAPPRGEHKLSLALEASRDVTLKILGKASLHVYDDRPTPFHSGFSGGGLWMLTSETIQNKHTNTLIQAACFVNRRFSDGIVAFRGTDLDVFGRADGLTLIQDASLLLEGTFIQAAVKASVEFANKCRKHTKGSLLTTGHSLGGYLAESVASILDLNGAAFNSPGPLSSTSSIRSLTGPWRPGMFEIHLAEFDPVSVLFPSPVNERHISTPILHKGCSHNWVEPYYGSGVQKCSTPFIMAAGVFKTFKQAYASMKSFTSALLQNALQAGAEMVLSPLLKFGLGAMAASSSIEPNNEELLDAIDSGFRQVQVALASATASLKRIEQVLIELAAESRYRPVDEFLTIVEHDYDKLQMYVKHKADLSDFAAKTDISQYMPKLYALHDALIGHSKSGLTQRSLLKDFIEKLKFRREAASSVPRQVNDYFTQMALWQTKACSIIAVVASISEDSVQIKMMEAFVQIRMLSQGKFVTEVTEHLRQEQATTISTTAAATTTTATKACPPRGVFLNICQDSKLSCLKTSQWGWYPVADWHWNDPDGTEWLFEDVQNGAVRISMFRHRRGTKRYLVPKFKDSWWSPVLITEQQMREGTGLWRVRPDGKIEGMGTPTRGLCIGRRKGDGWYLFLYSCEKYQVVEWNFLLGDDQWCKPW